MNQGAPISEIAGIEQMHNRRTWNSSFPLRLSERKLILAFVDLLCLCVALLLTVMVAYWMGFFGSIYIVRLTGELLAFRPGGSPLIWAALLAGVWFPVASAFGLYEADATLGIWRSCVQVAKATITTITVFVLVPYATPFMASRSVLFLLISYTLLCTLLGRLSTVSLLSQSRFRHRTLIVGAGWAGRTLLEAVASTGKSGYEVVGFLDDDPQKLGIMVDSVKSRSVARQQKESTSVRVLGNRKVLKELVTKLRVSTIVLAITREVDAGLMQILMDCLECGVEIVPMPVLYEQITGRVPVEHVGENWYVSMPISHRAASPPRRLVKRVSDIVLSILGLLILMLFMPLIALAIYLDSPGPIFYVQERLGKGGRRFRAWKFRSMKPNAETKGPVWAKRNDSRVTRVGKWLRKTHIDEFPQFWNILKGEMSAVGPRPERPEFISELEKSIPFYRTRLMVKPGMAGWGLVKQGYGASEQDALIKLQYDLYYIKHQSIFLDIVILVRTIFDTLSFRGR